MDINIINSLVTLLVGSVALIVYKLSKKHEKASASNIIVMDIRHAESVVQSILEKGSVDKIRRLRLRASYQGKTRPDPRLSLCATRTNRQ